MEELPETVKPTEEQQEPMKAVDSEDSFSEVRRKRKREKESGMETSEALVAGEEVLPAKRPVFPPVDASSTLVGHFSRD